MKHVFIKRIMYMKYKSSIEQMEFTSISCFQKS